MVKKKLNFWTRKLHRWGAILTCIPMLLVIGTGLLLQLKKQIEWVQPPTESGVSSTPQIDFDEILAAARAVEQADIDGWDDIDRLDVRPGKGVVKVRAKSRWEIQIDTENGEVLTTKYRRSDLIESLHDGSFFSDQAKLWLFFPNGLVLLGLWVTGLYLWGLPVFQKRANRRKRAARAGDSPTTAS